MAVIAVWKCDRDGAMFDNKKDADEHDKMLELAANITALIEKNIDIDEKQSEAIGILLARFRDKLALACKGKPEILLEDLDEHSKTAEVQNNAASSGLPSSISTENNFPNHSQGNRDKNTNKSASPVSALAANE